ncbi:hypothetical protein PHMEG_00026897 [Phytophthora megakarya]|uniref:MULE transposase domain-containing protein n=1 Tax=Phytophthora megakarya TaxID=4795 RepID=A0A225V9X2_9STRA|nr:hypothetical protein PHMEG_00026897 [Phytophthora megakarya]
MNIDFCRRLVHMCAPKFKQCIVFTTYGRSTKGYYPAARVLCTSKRYDMYFHAIRLVLDATDYAMDPEFTYCDFKASLIRAIRDHFPDTSPIGELRFNREIHGVFTEHTNLPDFVCGIEQLARKYVNFKSDIGLGQTLWFA